MAIGAAVGYGIYYLTKEKENGKRTENNKQSSAASKQVAKTNNTSKKRKYTKETSNTEMKRRKGTNSEMADEELHVIHINGTTSVRINPYTYIY